MREKVAILKKELRSTIRSKRTSISGDEAKNAADRVAANVMGLEEYRNAKTLLAYSAIRGELDVSKIVDDAISNGKTVAFPLCLDGGGLRLLVPNDETAFKIGAYGILEPDINNSRELCAEELDLIIAPGIAFDMFGNRLGQGGGYYDRLIDRTNAYTIGVGYDFQLFPELAVEIHDKRLDCIVTPSEILRNCKQLVNEP